MLKISVEDGVISTTAIINFQRHVRIICSYDMDLDGFYDILYIDDKNNVGFFLFSFIYFTMMILIISLFLLPRLIL